jgi:hypothetical protein
MCPRGKCKRGEEEREANGASSAQQNAGHSGAFQEHQQPSRGVRKSDLKESEAPFLRNDE